MKSFLKYLLLIVPFVACNESVKTNKKAIVVPTQKLDTIKTFPPVGQTKPLLFETAFISGTTGRLNKETLSLYGINIGKIKLSGGRLVACDPMHIDEYGIPFTQLFAKGEYPVQLAIAKLDLEERVAFARILISDAPVFKWEFALQEGQSQLPMGLKKRHGYSVDGGVGIFIDEAAAKVLDRKVVNDMDGAVFAALDKNYRNDWKYTLYPFGEQNLAAFSTGIGDGYYSTYIGFDAAGNPCRVLTDLGIIEWKMD
jgi:Protein of unknown function (DUF4241)